MPDFAADIEHALRTGLRNPDDLAFLALTGKIEGTVRDAVALQLAKDYAARSIDNFVCREHKGCDLAIFDSEDRAVVALEFKDCGSADLREENLRKTEGIAPKTYADLVKDDLGSGKCPGAKPLAVLTCKSISGDLSGLRPHGLKYRTGGRGFAQFCGPKGRNMATVAEQAQRCDEFVKRRLNVLYQGHVAGKSRALDIRIDWWLVDDVPVAPVLG